MAIAVQILSKLERRITLSIPSDALNQAVEEQVKKKARTVRMPGFRPGKAPLKMVMAQYAGAVYHDVLNDKLWQAFFDAAEQSELRVAGAPTIEPASNSAEQEGQLFFDATFEIYPEVVISDLNTLELEQTVLPVTEQEIDKTIEVLRKQRVQFSVKEGAQSVVESGDRVTIDFVGKIDGEEFAGGKADDYQFVTGQGQMLADFENAVLGKTVDSISVFPLTFPEDYHGREVAGKTAEFTVKLKSIEAAELPVVDAEFAKQLGVEDGDIQKMRDDIRANLEREVETRLQTKNKQHVMDALLKGADFEVPKALLEKESAALAQNMKERLAQQGMDVAKLNLGLEHFKTEAERRVKLGLIILDLADKHQLRPNQDQIIAHVTRFAQSYENPAEVVQWYISDRERVAQIEPVLLEQNVVDHIFKQAKTTEKPAVFEELMGIAVQ